MILSIKPKPLIVTQQLIIAADLFIQLTKLNYDVIGICNSSDELFKAIESAPPNVILIDLGLKGAIDAIHLGNQIHKEYEIPVIYLNPGMDEKTIARAILTFPKAFVNIPYKTLELKSKIETPNRNFNKRNLGALYNRSEENHYRSEIPKVHHSNLV